MDGWIDANTEYKCQINTHCMICSFLSEIKFNSDSKVKKSRLFLFFLKSLSITVEWRRFLKTFFVGLPIVYNGVEYIPGLFQSVDSFVFQQDLIEFGAGREEEDGGHRVEALEPLLTLRSLTAHVHKQERNVLDHKREFNNALEMTNERKRRGGTFVRTYIHQGKGKKR